MKKLLIIITINILAVSNIYPQAWLREYYEKTNADRMLSADNTRINFYEMQEAFYDYFRDKDSLEKGKGWKQFKRWEWFWAPRVYPAGELPEPAVLYEEWQEQRINEEKSFKENNSILSGANWTFLGPSVSSGGYEGLGRVNTVMTDPNNSNFIFAGAASGGLWKSTNGGSSWAVKTDNLPSLGVSDIAVNPDNSNIMYMATGDCDAYDSFSVGIMKSTDAGESWNTTGLNWTVNNTRVIGRILIDENDSDVLYAGTSSGIYRSQDAGLNWSRVFSTAGIWDMEIKPGSNPATIYAASRNRIYKSTDGGSNWSTLGGGLPTSGIERIALAVTPDNSGNVYAVYARNTDDGLKGVYFSSNSGSNWTEIADSSPNFLDWNADGSDSGGQGWYDLCIAVPPNDENTIYIGGINTWKMTYSGGTWSYALETMWTYNGSVYEVHADQHDFWFDANGVMWVGNDGGVYKRQTNGVWSWIGSGIHITQFYRLGTSYTDNDRIIAGSQDNGTKYTNNTNWYDEIGGDGMECIIDYNNADVMYGELYYGTILRTTNGGSDWIERYPSTSEYAGWVTPYVMHPANSSILFTGYENVWKTTNKGDSWSRISSWGNSPLSVLHVSESNPDYIYASNGYSIFKKTTNGGSSWSNFSNPNSNRMMTYMAVHPADPNVLWAVFSGYETWAGGRVFKSTDGGSSWSDISGSLPEVPVNTIVYEKESDDRIFIGTDLGIYYRDNGTSGWTEFNDGLPNVIVNELEISYNADKIRAATYGRGLWESDLPDDCPDDLSLNDITVAYGEYNIYKALNNITAVNGASYFVIQNGGCAEFTASNSITLKPGFHAQNGSSFKAFTDADPCSYIPPPMIDPYISNVNEKIVSEEIFLSVYPNPSSGKFTIKAANTRGSYLLEIRNLLGELIYIKNNSDGKELQVDLSQYSSGIYFIKAVINGRIVSSKLILQRD